MFFAGELIADFDAWRPALCTVAALVWLHGRCQAQSDVVALYDAPELSRRAGPHHDRYTVLSHIFSDVSGRAVGTDRRWPCLHGQFHGSIGSSMQGFAAQQPEHDTHVVDDYTLAPAGRLHML